MKKASFFILFSLLVATLVVAIVLPAIYRDNLLNEIEGGLGIIAGYMQIAKETFYEKQPEANRQAEKLEKRAQELLREVDVCRQAKFDRKKCLDDLIQKTDVQIDAMMGFYRKYNDRLIRLLQEKAAPVEIDPDKLKRGRGLGFV
jgi:hypothetical protein